MLPRTVIMNSGGVCYEIGIFGYSRQDWFAVFSRPFALVAQKERYLPTHIGYHYIADECCMHRVLTM